MTTLFIDLDRSLKEIVSQLGGSDVKLEVGGEVITAPLSTLMMLDRNLSVLDEEKCKKNEDGVPVVDRDPRAFKLALDSFVDYGVSTPDSAEDRKLLLQELEHFGEHEFD